MPRPFPKKISQIKPTLTEVAQSSHFIVEFGGLSGTLRRHLRDRGMNARFISDNLSLLCNRASLPGSGLATADVIGNFTCLLYTSPSPRDKRQSRMPSSA